MYAKFVPDTVTSMRKLVRKWEEDGTLKKLLEIKNKYMKKFYFISNFLKITFFKKKILI